MREEGFDQFAVDKFEKQFDVTQPYVFAAQIWILAGRVRHETPQ